MDKPPKPKGSKVCATRDHNCGAPSCSESKGGCFLLRQQGWHWDYEKRELVKDEPDACSPWAKIEQRDLDTVHQLWLAERITPRNGGTH
jgi:hypothetical protein